MANVVPNFTVTAGFQATFERLFNINCLTVIRNKFMIKATCKVSKFLPAV
ncbi:hypothetical protein KSF78_0005188 [Schistosoma japonicum]|nr:hypothetical protein KSF78_0005188 [Schistosoma japonicum]